MFKPLHLVNSKPTGRPGNKAAGTRARLNAPTVPALTRRQAVCAAASTAALVTAGLAGCSKNTNQTSASQEDSSKPATGSTFAFDTYCTFTVWGDDTALSQLSAACAHYNELFDLYNPSSDVARINAAQGAATAVDPDTAQLIALALEYCAQADGLST